MNSAERKQLQAELRSRTAELLADLAEREAADPIAATTVSRSAPMMGLVQKTTDNAVNDGDEDQPFNSLQTDVLCMFVNQRAAEIVEENLAEMRTEIVELRAKVAVLTEMLGSTNGARSTDTVRPPLGPRAVG